MSGRNKPQLAPPPTRSGLAGTSGADGAACAVASLDPAGAGERARFVAVVAAAAVTGTASDAASRGTGPSTAQGAGIGSLGFCTGLVWCGSSRACAVGTIVSSSSV